MDSQPSDQMDLGPVLQDRTIKSALGPFHKVNAPVVYPRSVVEALKELYSEFCATFRPPTAGIEWETDYQMCRPAAFCVQVDMMGLPPSVLEELATMPVNEVKEGLRHHIFEIEPGIAMYALLEGLFSDGRTSAFAEGWRSTLDSLRRNAGGRPIALLAVTPERYDAVIEAEFGGTLPNPATVKRLTGFDALFGPTDFREMVEKRGDCPYQLFVRASDPIEKLRRPHQVQVDHPLLGDPEMRRLIRARTVTLNVDDPNAPRESWVNDTKAYMPAMGLGFGIKSWNDLTGEEFAAYLKVRGITLSDALEGRVTLRFKPMVAAYGGYGHLRGVMTDKKFRENVKANLKRRGAYIVQPEMPTSMALNTATGMEAGYIDRLFIGAVDGRPVPIAGFRNFMPVGSGELEAGRIHGNGAAFWSEIHLR